MKDMRQRSRDYAREGDRYVIEHDRNDSHGIAWFVAGVGIGALVGVLSAPKSGRETRGEIAHRAHDGSEYLRHRSRDAAKHVGELMDRGKGHVGKYVDRGREYVDRGREQWQKYARRGKGTEGEAGRVGAALDAGREAYRSTTREHAEYREPSE